MDLRYRLEHNERDWLKEKAELLERFDVERREWESQLKDMQRKIEEVRCVVLCIFNCSSILGRFPTLCMIYGVLCTKSVTFPSYTSCSTINTVKTIPLISAAAEYEEKKEWKEEGKSSTDAVIKTVCALIITGALKEIARVSEELCSYQDEIRKKSGDKSQIYDDLRALERENWITLSPDNTGQANRAPSESWRTSAVEPDSYRDTQTSPGVLSEIDAAAPPIPPRSSSWNLNSPTHPDTELHIPESPMTTVRKCHSPCVLVDKKCSSPSIVRKFGAMLQENEGKVLIDGVVASCSVPANSHCNMGCCHSRWSCDASKFSNSKLSAYGTVQKSFSEVNILSPGKDLRSDNLNNPELQMPPLVKELSVDLLLSSLEIPPASSNLQGSRRNIMLEQKTAEFNRTLFQAEMGRGVEEQDSFTATDASSLAKPQPARVGVSLQQPPAENKQRQMTQPGHQAQPRHVSVPPSQSDSSRHGPRMMNDHPWKPLTLAAYPRPEGSRSNYGAVERILKNYESAARAQQSQSQQSETTSSPHLSVRQEENITELDMLDMDPLPLPPTLRHTQTSHTSRTHTTHENEESCVSSSSVQKNFSRPARPANRRLPSRWASRSPTSSSSTSSSPSTTPVMPPSFSLQKHTSSFTFSHAFHIETVII
uniref:SOGA 1/2-like coiled-coil domain-containing protein n=1 Tax=Seriola dumerili TaxID=41447 RepID=A0A3B4UG59_SERDU